MASSDVARDRAARRSTTSPAGWRCPMPPAGTRPLTTGASSSPPALRSASATRPATLIATAAALPYDAATGWISMVLVDAAHRHRGIAEPARRCLRRVVARRPAASPVLDATPAGAAVYAKIGFVAGFAFERWEGDGAATIAATGDEERHRRRGAVAGRDADRARPRALGGVDRALLLRSFLARPATRAWLAPRGERLRAAPRRPPRRAGRSDRRRRRRAPRSSCSASRSTAPPAASSSTSRCIARRSPTP